MKEAQWKSSSRPKTIRFFEQYVLPPFGDVRLDQLDRFAIQMHLNELAKKFSYSVVSKFRVYMKAMLDEVRIPGEGERDSGMNVKNVPG